jgi:hypothetical protein
MVFFILDDRAENHTKLDLHLKKYWHWAGGAIHIWAGTLMGYTFGIPWGVLTAACTWYFMDGALNTWVFHKEWWHLGTTADLDKFQRWLANRFHLDYRVISATLKNGLLLAALIGIILSVDFHI